MIWNPEKLNFNNAMLDAWVIRSPNVDALEHKKEVIRPNVALDITLVLRYPPVLIWPAYPERTDKELWKIRGLRSFDSIRFAKAVFNAPEDKYFLEGVNSLEAIIAMLSEGFGDGDFRLVHVSGAQLVFDLTKPNVNVTRKQYALLDKLNKRFFKGPHMRAVDSSPPFGFAIGAV